jgi:flagellum-specific ATP synthase
LAQKGIFPALNILKSLSRVALSCYSSEQKLKIFDVRQLIDRFLGVEELVRLGVYRKGTDELTDRALNFYTSFIQVLCQDRYEKRSLQASWDILKNLLK